MHAEEVLFDGEFLKKLEYLHILSKRLFSGQFRADRRTRKFGSGLEFADHRGYTPGDDFRHVDWKAYQRLDRLLLRLFQEEQDLPIYLMVDCSRSMAPGRPSKLQYSRQIAAALCYIGLAHLDRVSMFAYTRGLVKETAPQRGKGRILRVFDFLRELEAAGQTDAKSAFSTFCARQRPRGVAVVISDFLDTNGPSVLDILRYAKHDIVAIHVVDPADASPGIRGEVQLVDAETGGVKSIDVTPALAAVYEATFERFCDEIERYCSKYSLAYLRTDTRVPFEDAVLQVFRQGRFLA